MNRSAAMNDCQLLQDFVEQGSEAAFRELVQRHLPLVFGVARRVTGDAALAEEIAQAVFVLLARKASVLRREVVLAGWLFRTTRFVASRTLRAEQRRRHREQEATVMQLASDPDPLWAHLAPQLDEALASLRESDRRAVILRFFEQRPLRDVGAVLGLSEEAAKKRVARALDKLRAILTRRGVALSAPALGTLLAAYAVPPVSAELAVSVATASLAQAAASATGLLPLVDTIMTKGRGALALAAAVLLVAPLVLQHRANAVLRADNVLLRETTNLLTDVARLREENQRLAGLRVNAEDLAQLRSNRLELLRLRGEAALLRRAAEEAPQAGARTDSWRVGARVERSDWHDAGQASPEATVQTYWWAAATGNADRLRQCCVPREGNDNVSAEYAALDLKDRSERLNPRLIGALRLTSIARADADHATVEIDQMHRIHGINGQEIPETELQRAWSNPVKESYEVRNIQGQWRLVRADSLEMLGFLDMLRQDRNQAAAAWPGLKPEVAAEVFARMGGSNIWRVHSWMRPPSSDSR